MGVAKIKLGEGGLGNAAKKSSGVCDKKEGGVGIRKMF